MLHELYNREEVYDSLRLQTFKNIMYDELRDRVIHGDD